MRAKRVLDCQRQELLLFCAGLSRCHVALFLDHADYRPVDSVPVVSVRICSSAGKDIIVPHGVDSVHRPTAETRHKTLPIDHQDKDSNRRIVCMVSKSLPPSLYVVKSLCEGSSCFLSSFHKCIDLLHPFSREHHDPASQP